MAVPPLQVVEVALVLDEAVVGVLPFLVAVVEGLADEVEPVEEVVVPGHATLSAEELHRDHHRPTTPKPGAEVLEASMEALAAVDGFEEEVAVFEGEEEQLEVLVVEHWAESCSDRDHSHHHLHPEHHVLGLAQKGLVVVRVVRL